MRHLGNGNPLISKCLYIEILHDENNDNLMINHIQIIVHSFFTINRK